MCAAFRDPILGHYDYKISSSDDAQAFFNDGLEFEFNFNQPDAQRAFNACITVDSSAPMCYWGLAYSLGPFINKPLIHDDTLMNQAYDAAANALKLAQLHADALTLKEKKLIEAMALRYPRDTSSTDAQVATYKLYSDAMLKLKDQFPEVSNR